MIDFITLKDVDVQGLLNMLHYAEKAECLRMHLWIAPCGTFGCLVGTFCINQPNDALFIDPFSKRMRFENFYQIEAVAKRFNITEQEANFLFYDTPKFISCYSTRAYLLTKEEAIKRLRKFLYYKMRKAELLNDYETARRTGSLEVSKHVLEHCS